MAMAMSAAEAHAAAAAEGLAPLPASVSTGGRKSKTGFWGVHRSPNDADMRPFRATPYHGGRQRHLGSFATAEEAALAVARFLGPAGVAAVLAPPAPEPAPMTAADAHAAAAEEGLALLRAENAAGFKGVSRTGGSASKPFQAQLMLGGRTNYLGYFATAEEAALAVARFLGPEGVAAELAPPAPPAPEPTMTAAEAHATAAAEGLALLRADNPTGFKFVGHIDKASKPFKARVWQKRRNSHLGSFATAEQAALAVARFLGPEGVAAALAADEAKALEPAPMTAAEALAAAEAEGLTLVRAENTTGFKGVYHSNNVSKPFHAQLRHGGPGTHLGSFATAEEAALAVARFLAGGGRRGAARPQAPRRQRRRPSAPPSKRGKQPADDDDEEYVVKAEAVSDDDGPPTPPTPAPVLCYCERPAALLDGRWVCAQLVEGDFCILGREDE